MPEKTPDRTAEELVLDDLRKAAVIARKRADDLRAHAQSAAAEAYDIEATIERLEKYLTDKETAQ